MNFPIVQLIFPDAVHADFVKRQQIINGGFYELYNRLRFQPPRIYCFKSPLALQYALNFIYGYGRQSPDHGFTENYPGFCNDLYEGNSNFRNINRLIWAYVGEKIAAPAISHGCGNSYSDYIYQHRQIFKALEEAVISDLKLKLGARGFNFSYFSYHPGFKDHLWLTAVLPCLGHFDQQHKDVYLNYREMVQAGLMYSYLFKDMVLWCPMPETACFNSAKELHNEKGPAIRWADGYKQYYWQGTKIMQRIAEYPETITGEDINLLGEDNLEYVKKKLGPERFSMLYQKEEVV